MKKLTLDTEQYTDAVTQSIYSQDASIYQITPSAVVVPRNIKEVKSTVQYAANNKLSITPRGAGTNTTGACLGSGIILDVSRHLTAIRSFDEKTGRILVEPGLVQDELNNQVARYGLRLGPDTSTGDRATIGGMTACNASGARSLHFGSMRKAVVGIELLLASGETLFLKEMQEYGSHRIFQQVHQIAKKYHDEIKKNFPKFERNSSGYPLLELINPNGIDFAKLIVGSEGTLGVITAIELQLEKQLPPTELIVLTYDSIEKAIEFSQSLLQFKPISLELLDQTILRLAPTLPNGVNKNAQAILIAEFENAPTNIGGTIFKNPQEIQAIWAVRKGGLGILLSQRSKRRAIGFIEDMAVPPENLLPFYKELNALFQKNEIQAGIYGHVGSGCLHIRPFFNLIEDRKRIEEIANYALRLTKKYQGVYSSEHGDGLIRSWATEEFFGTPLFEAMKEIKKAFDPNNMMNPGKIIPNQKLLDNLRQAPLRLPFQPIFKSHQRGGMELTVDLCNGNGSCRKMQGTMCPSYQVTKDEHQTTRGRALALKGVMTGDIPKEEIFKESFKNVFDLCIQCKGCAHECPSHIDVSKLKSEILNFQNKEKGAPLRSKIFGNIGSFLRLGALFPKFSNWFSPILSFLLKFKSAPKIAPVRFSHWARQNHLTQPNTPDVLLFSDTFTEFLHPEIGIAAVKVLKACGLKVQVLPWSCCGRTAISKGFLDTARDQIKKLHNTLSYTKCPLIILEPSCFSIFIDEAQDLGYNFSTPILFEEFLLKNISLIEKKLKRAPFPIALQKHCHLKTNSPLVQLVRAIPDAQIIPLDAGCCGMAGSFGHESEHVEISQKIFNRDLGNKLKKCDKLTKVIANGTSCRTQIERFLPCKVLHIAQLFAELVHE